ncbi:hypothetical protein ACVV2G_01695 [Streptomyces ziwulingensis]
MSDALEKAEAAAREAAANTDVARIALAALELAKTTQQSASQHHQCEHQHKARRSAGEWIGIACAVCVGGVGIAFASLALAILGGTAAIVVLVLRSMWTDYQRKGR